MVKAGTKYAETNGLLRILPAALELLYTVTVNINTTDGLINGAPCTLKKIQYFNQAICANPTYNPSILWVLFEDSQIGQQWRQRYRHFYTTEIEQSWTPIFSIGRNFSVLNGKVLHKQFPLRPAGATTIHSAQGGTYKQICIDMDISDSIGLQKNEHLAKLYLKHAHYVSASRVTTLEGLQIIN